MINGITAILFWVALGAVERAPGVGAQAVLKFVMYLSIILWLNSGYYLSQSARGVEVKTWEFQKDQVKLTLWIVGIFIVMELPIWLVALSGS